MNTNLIDNTIGMVIKFTRTIIKVVEVIGAVCVFLIINLGPYALVGVVIGYIIK
jgi:hypothetical protein